MESFIEIRGVRENNLKGVSLRVPKRKITIFTGVSGSGKPSIVFDTVATKAQRQLYENFSLFVRNFLPKYPPPEADAVENLSMAVIVDQKRLGGGSHSTVGTITDIYTLLRLLFSRLGKPPAGFSNAFSFNDPAGMCRERKSLGRKLGVIAEDFPDRSKSLAEGRCSCRSSRGGRSAPMLLPASSTSTRRCRSSSAPRWSCCCTTSLRR
jgi:excinuclease UvrABC ATPase subunit